MASPTSLINRAEGVRGRVVPLPTPKFKSLILLSLIQHGLTPVSRNFPGKELTTTGYLTLVSRGSALLLQVMLRVDKMNCTF